MIRAASLDEYAVRPAGTFWSGEHHLVLCENEGLYAVYLWGRPGGAEAQQLVRALAAEVRAEAQPHRAFVDFSMLSGIDSEAFAALREFLARAEERQKQVTMQEALIRPSGLVGAVVAGYYVLYPPPFPAKVFTDGGAGSEWLGLESEVVDRWRALCDQVRAVSPELMGLRSVIEAQIARVDLLSAASELGLSSRTLQRRLKHQGTTFQHQLDTVRRELAQNLIDDSDEKLGAIASRLGFASHQHFSEWFHRQTGETAEASRNRARR